MIQKLLRLRLNTVGIASLLILGIHSWTVPTLAQPIGPADSGTPEEAFQPPPPKQYNIKLSL